MRAAKKIGPSSLHVRWLRDMTDRRNAYSLRAVRAGKASGRMTVSWWSCDMFPSPSRMWSSCGHSTERNFRVLLLASV